MKYFAFILLLIGWTGCKNSLPPDFNSFGKLVYVEALSNSDGITAGSFGDIMIFDPIMKEKFRATTDQFYDESTSWTPDGTKIVFSSRRTGDRKYKDLSSPSRIFEVSLLTLDIHQIDKDFDIKLKVLPEIDGGENTCPKYTNSYSDLLFITSRAGSFNDGLTDQIILLTKISDQFSLLGKGLRGGSNLLISHGDNYYAYTAFRTTDVPSDGTAIIVYDFKTRDKVKRIAKKNWSFRACSFYEDKLYFTGKDWNSDKPPTNLYSLDLNRLDSTLLHTFTDFSIEELVMRDSTSAFFINKDSNHGNDIYLLDLKTWKAEALTTDGLQKMGLDYLPPKNDK